MSFTVGTRCWYPSKDHGWVAAEVVDVSHANNIYYLKLQLEGSEELVEINTQQSLAELEKLSSIDATAANGVSKPPGNELPLLRNPSILESTQDLTSLSYLNEPAVLHAIKSRYSKGNIYTYSGIVLIAANPFDNVDKLYSQEMISKYANTQNRDRLEPHIFAIAGEAYTRMINDGQNQTIVVSGESGAGKTVSAKYIMRYFASIEPQMSHDGSAREQSRMTEIEEKILATNPILEAFGNAKTTRNDNSSRFGKYLEIMFNEESRIVGARIRTYLLERSRLVFQPESERNYHIFYQMMAGLDSETKNIWQLSNVEDFHYMNQGSNESNYTIKGIDDKVEFERTKEALKKIGISAEMQTDIFQILAALLHIGNICITKTRNDATLASDENSLSVACQLLGIDNVGFAKWIVKKQINTRSEKIVSNLNFSQAMVTKDSVAKFIYAALFDLIVHKINATLENGNNDSVNETVKSFIGVLDIYGFEHFERNSFEQFCINYANEKLQQEFNQHVFKLEQEEYVREKIEWSFIDFNDNQPCIDLIENKLGILSLLDEESRLPAGSDETWAEKLYQCLDKPPTNSVFNKPRFGQTKFVVRHYANDVTYDVEGFIEKNRDTVPEGQFEVLQATTNKTLKLILDHLVQKQEQMAEQRQEDDKKPGAIFRRTTQKKPTLGSMFKASLVELMKTIESTNVHYIRCIKPNTEKTAWEFDNLLVLSQLRACGILETIRISCAGFPSRWTFMEFIERFYFLSPMEKWRPIMGNESVSNESKISFSKDLLNELVDDEMKYQVGTTKVFFKAGILAQLENIRTTKLVKVCTVIQKNIRGLNCRREYLRTIRSIKSVQAYSRGRVIRDFVDFELKTRAAILIQSILRGRTQFNFFVDVLRSTVKVQSYVRQKLAKLRVELLRREQAITKIQKLIRSKMTQRYHLALKKSTLTIQCHIRKTIAQNKLILLRQQYNATNSEQLEIERSFTELMEKIHFALKQDNEIINLLSGYEKNGLKDLLNSVPGYEQTQEALASKSNELDSRVIRIQSLVSGYSNWKDNLMQEIKQFKKQSVSSLDNSNLNKQLNEMTKEIDDLKTVLMKGNTTGKTTKKEVIGLGIASPITNSPKIGFNELHDLSTMLNDMNIINQEIGIILRNIGELVREDEQISKSHILANITNSVLESYFKIGKYNDAISFVKENVSSIFEVFSTFRRDDLVSHGMFWVSNIYHIYLNLTSIRQNENGNRALAIHKIETEYKTLLSHCFDTWLKRVIQVIGHQYMLSRALLGSPSATVNHDERNDGNENLTKIIEYFEYVYRKVNSSGIPQEVADIIISNILSCIDSTCCNYLLNKFHNLSWKTGVRIDQNIGAIIEWDESHRNSSIVGCGQLPLLKQISKLLQLRISNVYDINFVIEVCYSLNVTQIHTILKKYKPTEYEPPMSSDVLNYLSNTIKKNGRAKETITFSEDTKALPDPFCASNGLSLTSTPRAAHTLFEVTDLADATPIVHKIITMAQ
ncbi:similar to Saccharomyces cerevisiae YAL029C MYO4 One of two type V myosin motors (along with MYO2) involved in actin-based transport of cargos [Maudiozyma saulgeensis]|uniref:Similar to Saccharomyces cerevisiae YAL029C MYO4 One of two type V myosin motors (Along with MYO2) involved in actin-based transport of cargos n=1 Tax=Maudiozyma saulgeensis TaxID=1789683 RepID=A0A1X7R7A4_9SACH|nr:similar to Saccharomyces cerevisiae YAL029C MYO4 One of two type V myosin motors (along with MYO2) involved in actin-based transport of cargos [Kazachstania saulgeensis]